MTLTLTTITHDEALAFILGGMQAKRAEIDATLRDLRSQLNGDAESVARHEREHGRYKRSPAARKRMAEAQRARWAKRKEAGK